MCLFTEYSVIRINCKVYFRAKLNQLMPKVIQVMAKNKISMKNISSGPNKFSFSFQEQ